MPDYCYLSTETKTRWNDGSETGSKTTTFDGRFIILKRANNDLVVFGLTSDDLGVKGFEDISRETLESAVRDTTNFQRRGIIPPLSIEERADYYQIQGEYTGNKRQIVIEESAILIKTEKERILAAIKKQNPEKSLTVF